jgi:FYVE/RhoGEF/PH domain-containing protein 5/6
MAKYEAEIRKVITLQRFMRKWLRISKLRNTALNFLIAPESERLRKRNMALREIVSTERVFVNNLMELQKSIILPLKATSHNFISEKEVGILFSNLESIAGLNIQILESMEERIEAWPSESRFADIFIEKAPVLRLYTDYLNNYEQQVLLLTKLEKKPAFMQYIKACKAKMNLANYLILPVQRLPRYEILLEGLKRYTAEEHVDYPNIIAALDKVKELNQHVDKKKKDKDNRLTINEIQKAISGVPTLYVAHRQFIREGLIDVLNGKKKEKLYVYLFTDFILLTKAKVKTLVPGAGRPKSKLKDTVYFKDGPFSASPVSVDGAAIRLVGGKKEYLFCFPSDTSRDHWQKDIEAVLRDEGWKKIFY